jgi:hypothetical protein
MAASPRVEMAATPAPAQPNPFEGVNWDFADSTGRAATHALHPWPARFIPDLPAIAIARLTEPGDLVTDPFCGCGTTALEARLAGRRFDVADANELATLITRAKCWPPGEEERALIFSWLAKLSPQRPSNELLGAVPPIPNRSYWFSDEVACQLAYLLREIQRLGRATDYLRVAFSAIVTAVSNQESETRYRRVDKRISADDVIERFRSQAIRALGMAAELDIAPPAQGFVACRDARAVQTDAPRADLAVFSPPYPNAFDYHLYHRFRMFWVGFDPVQAKHTEIGAHLRYEPDERGWLADMTASFDVLYRRLRPAAHAVCVVGDGIIKGERIPSGDLLWDEMPTRGFHQIDRFVRAVPAGRKSFRASDGRLKSEHVLVFQRASD